MQGTGLTVQGRAGRLPVVGPLGLVGPIPNHIRPGAAPTAQGIANLPAWTDKQGSGQHIAGQECALRVKREQQHVLSCLE